MYKGFFANALEGQPRRSQSQDNKGFLHIRPWVAPDDYVSAIELELLALMATDNGEEWESFIGVMCFTGMAIESLRLFHTKCNV